MRERGVDIPVQDSHVLLLEQIDQLAAQIVKSKDDVSEAQGTAKMAHPSMYRSVRALQRMAATGPVQNLQKGGLNF